jgi:hypothetical protein
MAERRPSWFIMNSAETLQCLPSNAENFRPSSAEVENSPNLVKGARVLILPGTDFLQRLNKLWSTGPDPIVTGTDHCVSVRFK